MLMADKLDIQTVIARFANSFDIKDWGALQSCLTELLYTDYSDLRGTPPQTVSAVDYVDTRRAALEHLMLHHLVSNYEVEVPSPDTAVCRASMIVWRKSEKEEFTSHCIYDFQLTKQEAVWKISGITQKILWNEGTSSIHNGAKV